jgi:hypothetical protein
MGEFKIDELPELSFPLSKEELKRFVDDLLDGILVFRNKVVANEATARQFISVFLISAVSHALRYIDQTIRLKVEFELNGSKGYILNYVVIIRGILISITEAR